MSICAIIGSIVPDLIEGKPENNYKKWRRNHRQRSHWFVPYSITGCIIWFYKNYLVIDTLSTYISRAILYVLLGSILHIIQDSLCGKVPGVFFKQRYGYNFFKVGSLQEYIFTYLLVFILLYIVFYKGKVYEFISN